MQPDATPLDPHRQALATANARHRALLEELVDMGMDLARLIHAQVHAQTRAEAAAPPPATPDPATPNAPAPPAPLQHLATAFDRITRCVRRTVLLAEHLAKPAPDPAQAARDQAARAEATLATARRRLARRMEYLIADRVPAGPRADALHREAMDRLDGPDVIADLLTLPVNQLAVELGEDLQLFSPRNRRRTPADAARLLRRAAGHAIPAEPPTRPGAGPPLWTHRDDPAPHAPPPHLPGLPPADQALIRRLLDRTPPP